MPYRHYMSGRDAVLSVAPTTHGRADEATEQLPTTPSEIATEVHECRLLGVSIAVLYGRSDDGTPSVGYLPDVATAVREQTSDVLIEYASGPETPLGDYLDAIDDGPRPDLARVRVSSGQHGRRGIVDRSRHDVDRFVSALRDRGIKPDLLVSDSQAVHEVYRMLEGDTVTDPVVTVPFGAREGSVATPRMLLGLLDALPASAEVLVRGTGPNQFPMTTMSLFTGAHVQVGMDDNRYLHRDEPVERNTQLVSRVADVLRHTPRSVASAEDTAQRFSLPGEREQVQH